VAEAVGLSTSVVPRFTSTRSMSLGVEHLVGEQRVVAGVVERMPSKVTDTREPSKPRMRRLPPEVPYGSLLVKLTPGIWFRPGRTLAALWGLEIIPRSARCATSDRSGPACRYCARGSRYLDFAHALFDGFEPVDLGEGVL
jgi:hypothetical protein